MLSPLVCRTGGCFAFYWDKCAVAERPTWFEYNDRGLYGRHLCDLL